MDVSITINKRYKKTGTVVCFVTDAKGITRELAIPIEGCGMQRVRVRNTHNRTWRQMSWDRTDEFRRLIHNARARQLIRDRTQPVT